MEKRKIGLFAAAIGSRDLHGRQDSREAKCGGICTTKKPDVVTDGGEQPGTWEIVMCPLSSGSWNVIGIRII
jgi:hypothetical protein